MKYIKYISILLTVLLSSCSQLADRNPFTNEIEGFDYRFFLIPIVILGLIFVAEIFSTLEHSENPFSKKHLYNSAHTWATSIWLSIGFLIYNIIMMLILSSNSECDILTDLIVFCATVGVVLLCVFNTRLPWQEWSLSIVKIILILLWITLICGVIGGIIILLIGFGSL